MVLSERRKLTAILSADVQGYSRMMESDDSWTVKAITDCREIFARTCIKLDLIAGNVLFADGTKIRANASASRTHEKGWYEQQSKKVDQRIEQLLQECERVDQKEQSLDSFVAMKKQIDQANTVLTKPCKTACADAGYADADEKVFRPKHHFWLPVLSLYA